MNEQWIVEELKEIKKNLWNESVNKHVKTCDTTETVLRGKSIAIIAYVKKLERHQP